MKKLNVNKFDLLTYLYFFIITFCKGIGLSGNNKIYIIASLFGTLLILLKIFTTSLKKNDFLALSLITIIGIVDYFVGGTTTILFTALALWCLKDTEVKEIIKIMFWTRLFTFLIMIFLSTTGIIDNAIVEQYRIGLGTIKRYTLGYSHPNFTHSAFAIIVFLGGYLYGKKFNVFHIIAIGIINYALYTYTISRTGFLIVMMYLIVLYFHHRLKIVKKIESKTLKPLFFIIFGLSLFCAFYYRELNIINKIDQILTGRIYYLNYLINNYKIPLFGSNIYEGTIIFDNGYFSLLYEGGILATIYYMYFLIKSNNYLVKHQKSDEILLVIIFMIYCIFESYYPNILMNPSLLMFSYSIFNYKDEMEEEKNE